MQDLLNKKFNDREDAKEYYIKNAYDKYERRIRELDTKAVKKMVDAYKEVRKIFIKPSVPTPTDDETSETESEQQGLGLKILTPKQIIIRLPNLLAQLKAGKNSEKLKNEIRQIVYPLYR